MPGPSGTLRLGDTAPDFALDAATPPGGRVSLGSLLRGRRGLLLVFHRGMW